jgi:hypothetical protein
MLMTASLAGAVIVTSWAPSAAASPVPSAAEAGVAFASTLYPYTMTLPPGWSATPPDRGATSDNFEGPGASASVDSRGAAEPGQTVQQRVDISRGTKNGCTSDPAEDRPSMLGGEVAVQWTFSCSNTFTVARNTIHEGFGYGLALNVPTESEDKAPGLLDTLASTFTFTDVGAGTPSASPDLEAVAAQLEGTWQTEWAPKELWIATIRAAGLDPATGGFTDNDFLGGNTARVTIKFEDGRLVVYPAVDGGPDEVGWRGTYRLLDSHTIEAVDGQFFNKIVYDFTIGGDVLTMKVVSNTDPIDLIPQTSIYDTLPFTRVP